MRGLGSTIIYNGWCVCIFPGGIRGVNVGVGRRAISRDPNVFASPDEFMPERFLGENAYRGDDDEGAVFGYGRRFVAR